MIGNCGNCRKVIKRKPYAFKRSKYLYCSMNCRNEHYLITKKLELSNSGRFNKGHISWNMGNAEFRNCLVCNKKITVEGIRKKQKRNFCSRKHQWQYMRGKNHHCWRGGLSREPYTEDFELRIRHLIRKRDHYKCQLCGFTEYQNNIALSVHHIDYDKKNNNEDNLITLCQKCHNKTNHKRDDWKIIFQNIMRSMKENIYV